MGVVFRLFLLISVVLFFTIWSCYPSIMIYMAVFELGQSQIAKQIHAESFINEDKLIRSVQSHFLRYGYYIPSEDIVINNKNSADDKEFMLNMKKACGSGKLYVWLPLKVRIPLFGEKVIEWCLSQS